MPEQKRNIAVVGCGGWGKNIVRSLQALGRLGAVVDPSEAGRARAAELAPGIPVHASTNGVFQDDAIEGVMIATPAETHFDEARAAIAAGRDVFVEKPLTIDLEEARALEQLARDAGRILMVGHLLEYHPAVLKLRELIEDGELGTVQYVISNRLNLGKVRTEENALWSFAPHDIAVILRLVGHDPIQVVATGGNYVSPNIADVSVTQLLFDGGVRSHIFVSWLHPFKEQKLVVVGSRRMASFNDVSKELVLYDQRVEWQEGQPVPVKGDGVPVEYGDAEPLKEECLHFAHAIDSRHAPRTDGANGIRVLQVLHGAQRSLSTNGTPVELDLVRATPDASWRAATSGGPTIEIAPNVSPRDADHARI